MRCLENSDTRVQNVVLGELWIHVAGATCSHKHTVLLDSRGSLLYLLYTQQLEFDNQKLKKKKKQQQQKTNRVKNFNVIKVNYL